MRDFRKELASSRHLVCDGAYGTLLQSRGLPAGMSPEIFGLERPEVVHSVHADYAAAGASILTTNTFGGSRPKLGAGVDSRALNREMALVARKAAGSRALVAGSVGPTGLFVEPLGKLSFRELVEIFKEQIRGLVEGGVDLIKGETHFDLAEAKAIVVATREVCDLPLIMCMTFESAVSLTGTPPGTFVDTMLNLGVDVVGTNCSAGPDEMLGVAEAMLVRLDPDIAALHVQPNAGLPRLESGLTVFPLGPEEFAARAMPFADLGAKIIGGCCGTTPAHIAALAAALGTRTFKRPERREAPCLTLTTRAGSVHIGHDRPAVIIGERINPTGKQALTAELQAGGTEIALRFAGEQLAQGARVLDLNVGAPMVKEADLLPRVARAVSERFQAPICIDSADADAVEACLWEAAGSPLVNSISGEPGRMERLGPLCKKLGAPFILLPLKGRKLPVTAAERMAIIEDLLAQADSLGIPRRLILVDALALTVSSKPLAAVHSLEVMRRCRDELGLPTTIGLSNVSFGLPARELINSSFLSMSLSSGLTSLIANPASTRLMEALVASEVLLGRDPQAQRFIAGYSGWSPGEGGGMAAAAAAPAEVKSLGDAVIRGARDRIESMLDAALAEGRDPFALVNDELIPAIMQVGEKYERKEYFLPQLMLSAETMQMAFGKLRPLLEAREGGVARDVVVMATVEGDIHDIGKNIVCLLLRNHGFEVLDLGKDVPALRIVDEAERAGAKLIGLSALMTTTMVRMEDVVALVRERGLSAKVMIGGAVVTEAFARAIGADGYSLDAVSAVKLAKSLVSA